MIHRRPGWLVLLLLALLLTACGGDATPDAADAPADDASATATGTLLVTANGEDFVRQGFTSKDGWAITFDHVYLTLTDITAYQTDPPYDSESGEAVAAMATVDAGGPFTVDLADGDEDAEPIRVAELADTPAGHYNALAWRVVPAEEGDAADYALVIMGNAARDDETVTFTVRIPNEFTYTCGEYVGDERLGFVTADAEGRVEMTFHFDHIFGDGEMPADDGINTGALGFDPLAALAADGALDVTLADLESALATDDYAMLVNDILPTLGHVGEGHCHEGPLG